MMRRLLLSWLLLLVFMPGCIDRNRVNANCEWTGDSNFPIDLNNATHRQHLIKRGLGYAVPAVK